MKKNPIIETMLNRKSIRNLSCSLIPTPGLTCEVTSSTTPGDTGKKENYEKNLD